MRVVWKLGEHGEGGIEPLGFCGGRMCAIVTVGKLNVERQIHLQQILIFKCLQVHREYLIK